MRIKVCAVSFAKSANGGRRQVFNAIDYPGIQIINTLANRHAKWEKEIRYNGQWFGNLEAAVLAHGIVSASSGQSGDV